MAEGIATRSSRGHRTICLPIEEEDYLRIIHDPKAFRRTLDDCFRQTPELFPVNFALGYELKDDRMSAKECAGNNFPVFPKYVIKPSARSQTGRRAAWTPMHRKSNGR